MCLDEAWEIEKTSLSLGKELGSGQFGVSYTHPPTHTQTPYHVHTHTHTLTESCGWEVEREDRCGY